MAEPEWCSPSTTANSMSPYELRCMALVRFVMSSSNVFLLIAAVQLI